MYTDPLLATAPARATNRQDEFAPTYASRVFEQCRHFDDHEALTIVWWDEPQKLFLQRIKMTLRPCVKGSKNKKRGKNRTNPEWLNSEHASVCVFVCERRINFDFRPNKRPEPKWLNLVISSHLLFRLCGRCLLVLFIHSAFTLLRLCCSHFSLK